MVWQHFWELQTAVITFKTLQVTPRDQRQVRTEAEKAPGRGFKPNLWPQATSGAVRIWFGNTFGSCKQLLHFNSTSSGTKSGIRPKRTWDVVLNQTFGLRLPQVLSGYGLVTLLGVANHNFKKGHSSLPKLHCVMNGFTWISIRVQHAVIDTPLKRRTFISQLGK